VRVPAAFGTEGDVRDLALVDLSCLPKAGVKGPGGATWLADHHVPVPAHPNTWTGNLVARLTETEFFLEGDAADVVARALENSPQGVYWVPRQDTAIALTGRRFNDVLLETCAIDFAALDTGDALVMTSMAVVPVLVIPQVLEGLPLIRIWVDPSFGPYLWDTLLEIVQEQGGGPAGLASLYPRILGDTT